MGSSRRFRSPARLCAIGTLLAAAPLSAQPAAPAAKRPGGAARPPATAAAPARATPQTGDVVTTIEGRIVGVEEGDLVVDVGVRAGVAPGDVAELWRPLKLRNPATGQIVEDRYRTGSLTITEVLDVVSFARPEGEARRPPAPGDIVVLRVRHPAPPPRVPVPVTAAPGRPPPAPAQAADPDAASVTALFDSMRGTTLEGRARQLETWLAKNPSNRFATAVSEELSLLGTLLAARREPSPPGSSAPAPAPAYATPAPGPAPRFVPSPDVGEARALRFQPPLAAQSGAPLDFGVELSGEVRGAVLQSRDAGEPAYVSTPMRPEGLHFWGARVPANRVRAPGLEYFIEAVRPDGSTTPVVAGVDGPLRVSVADPPTPAPPLRHRSSASVYTDYADYNRLRHDDYAWQTEGYVGMRFDDVGVRAVRTGFGVYRGVGGSILELDSPDPAVRRGPRKVGLTYGHLEGEFGVSRTISLIGRLALGLGDDGVAGGGQAHLRIGNDLETNLLIGGEVLGGIGLRGIAQFALFPQSRVPFMVRTEVTNQPAGAQASAPRSLTSSRTATGTSGVGGRVVVQVGYRLSTPLVVFVRLSGEGRTIDHAGPGFGGGATYEW